MKVDEVTRARKSLEWLKERLDRVNATLDSNACWLAIQLLKKLEWHSFRDVKPDGGKCVLLWIEFEHGFPVVGHVEEDGSVWWLGAYGEVFFIHDYSNAWWMDITEPG